MGTTVTDKIRNEYYDEAIRYMENAKETLKKAGKEDDLYQDDKYVKTACGIAYCAVLKALDGFFILKEVKKQRGRKSIEYYRDNISKIDRKLLHYLNNAYLTLHLEGYYEGNLSVDTINSGLKSAYLIIDRIKPAA
jgi:ribosomal protein L22